jgi:L-alanine-DL-glutamate epimerase-like enolase superfamily enzyme
MHERSQSALREAHASSALSRQCDPMLPPAGRLGRIERVQVWALRVPIDEPVRTSFGTMRDRPAVWLALTGDDGAVGWGEVWCNFPSVGAEHRARLLADTIAPLVTGTDWADPSALQAALEQRLRVLTLQTGEPGPIAQAIAGVDTAAWDLVARRAGQPRWRVLGGRDPQVAVYASGINPDRPLLIAERLRDQGHTAFKLKVGFEADTDLANLRELSAALGADTPLMIDANQAWQPDEALRRARSLAECRPLWLEEPITADQPWEVWRAFASACPIPLAAGENLRGDTAFNDALRSGALAYVQPDVGKWGGVSGCLRVAHAAAQSGATYCPHWLGGAIGLMASLHLKAAAGGPGWVEMDANPNPLRDDLAAALTAVRNGHVVLTVAPGHGITPGAALLSEHQTWHAEHVRH